MNGIVTGTKIDRLITSNGAMPRSQAEKAPSMVHDSGFKFETKRIGRTLGQQ